MKLILLRHAESSGNAKGLSDGRMNVPLSPKGQKQAKALVPKLKKLHPDIILASPLKRAQDTIKPYLKATNQKLKVMQLTNERAGGPFDGKKDGAIREYCQRHNLNRLSFRPKGGESIVDVSKRAVKFLKYLKSPEFKNKTILIASHRNFLLALELAIKNIPINKFYKHKRLGNAGIRRDVLLALKGKAS